MQERKMSGDYSFVLPVQGEKARRLAAGWLTLAIAALVSAGLFSILLVMARTPYIKDVIPWNNFFKTAMVVHVNLAVLMWFLPIAGLIWSLNSRDRHIRWGWIALWLAAFGTAITTLSPFAGSGEPLMNNYFPVIDGPVFLTGMSIFGVGFLLLVIRSLMAMPPLGPPSEGATGLRIGTYSAAVAAMMALVALIWSFISVPGSMEVTLYYEALFWGAGHVLQFTHTMLMLVGWLWLASISGMRVPLTPRLVGIIFGLGVMWVFLTPWIYLTEDPASLNFTMSFTRLMVYGGGLAAVPFGLVILWGLVFGVNPTKEQEVYHTALIYSVLLFGAGGVIGLLILGSNTMITAHYHGSNGAITVAFMGLCYLLLPQLGFRVPSARLAKIQLHAYGAGQFLHVIGLAWAGGYGMQRKIAGSGQSLDNVQQTVGMALMGIGGLIAVIGGILFLIVMIGAMYPAGPGRKADDTKN
jgi:hypothetical protein